MVGHIRMHGANDANVVNALCGVWKDFAYFDAALAVLLKLVWRGERGPGLALRAQILAWQGLARELRQHRLGVEGVEVRRPAIHEKMNHALGLGREVRPPRRQRMVAVGRSGKPGCAIKQTSQSQRAHAHTGPSEKLTT